MCVRLGTNAGLVPVYLGGGNDGGNGPALERGGSWIGNGALRCLFMTRSDDLSGGLAGRSGALVARHAQVTGAFTSPRGARIGQFVRSLSRPGLLFSRVELSPQCLTSLLPSPPSPSPSLIFRRREHVDDHGSC